MYPNIPLTIAENYMVSTGSASTLIANLTIGQRPNATLSQLSISRVTAIKNRETIRQ